MLKEEIQRQHEELLQVRDALKCERLRAHDLEVALQEKEKTLEQQQSDYDRDLKEIISKLLVLESDFRKEQKEIMEVLRAANAKLEWQTKLLETKDKSIQNQRKELDSLKHANKVLLDSLSQYRHVSVSKSFTTNVNTSVDVGSMSITTQSQFVGTSSTNSLTSSTSRNLKSPRSPKNPRSPNSSRSPNSPRRSKKSADGNKVPRAESPWREELTSFF